MVSPTSIFYTIYTMLFFKYGGTNVAFKNVMSHFYMFFPTKDAVKLANENMEHAQLIGIILCCFPNCSIIYPSGTFYYCPGHPYNTIWSWALTFYAGFQKVTSEIIEHCGFFDSHGSYWRSPYQTQKYWLPSMQNSKNKLSKKQEYFCLNCLWPIKTKPVSDYSS